MENEMDYAEMLEIPVSTVSVVKKKSLFKRKGDEKNDLKDRVVESVNERTGYTEGYSATRGDFIQTENLTDIPVVKREKHGRDGTGAILIAEAVAACLIAGGIFVTNVFVPDTAINTFIGSLTAVETKESPYTDFKLTSVVSELSDAEISVSAEGVISFTDRTSVYPVCEGKVSSVTQANGLYTVQIAHTSTFVSVFTGLSTVYANVGDSVQANIPFAYSDGENEVRVSMYDGEKLLNCYTLSGAVPVWNS
ncbi:MAG: hypothetical protein ACI4L9_03000 [Candidatus Coproplasma sp.]